MSDGDPEARHPDLIAHFGVADGLQHLVETEMVLARVADADAIFHDVHPDRRCGVGQRALVPIGRCLAEAPVAGPRRLARLVHDLLEHQRAVLFRAPFAVDRHLLCGLEDDLQHAFPVRAALEELDGIERRVRRRGRGNENRRCYAQLHWRPARSASTMVGSASVEVSPKPSLAPSAIFLRMRRMIFPDRVFGSAGVKWIFSGAEKAPMSWRTS